VVYCQRPAKGPEGDPTLTVPAATTGRTAAILRLGAWAAYPSGVVSAIGLVFLIALYASFGVGAVSQGLVFGWINDVSAIVNGVLMLPIAVALHIVLRPHSPILSGVAMTIGIIAIAAITVLKSLLVLGALTFAQEIGPVLVAFLVSWSGSS